MEKPIYKRQANRQIAVVNMTTIIKDILAYYESETFGSMAAKIGVSVGTIKTWYRTGKARQKIADALIIAYPTSPKDPVTEIAGNPAVNQIIPLSGLFDQIIQELSEIRKRLGV